MKLLVILIVLGVLAYSEGSAMKSHDGDSGEHDEHSDVSENGDHSDESEQSDKDDCVYTFAYFTDYMPYSYVNEHYELIGFNYDIVRSICRAMHKTCEHIVSYDYKNCWNSDLSSPALNNHWWDVCVGYMQISERRSVYGFQANYAAEPRSYVYVRSGESIDTIDEVNENANHIGFTNGFWVNPACLERHTSIVLHGREITDYNSIQDMGDALANGEIDAMFAPEDSVGDDSRFEKAHHDTLHCAHDGPSMMMRKDSLPKYAWMEEGLEKIIENGDYDWACNNAERDGNPGCFGHLHEE